MTLADFNRTLSQHLPPAELPDLLKAMWWEAKGDWDKSHEVVQDASDRLGCWVHAYLHRKEGDRFNAKYWYDRAGRSFPEISLEQEWSEITQHLLDHAE